MENYNNWEERARIAVEHTNQMDKNYTDEINKCLGRSMIYNRDMNNIPVNIGFDKTPEYIVDDIDSVGAIFKYQEEGKRIAVLNFASYRNPGGKFIQGSKAQEECLCHESFLYNILRTQTNYYNWNLMHMNNGLYMNRALYTPDIRFFRDNKSVLCDVITCASPNRRRGNNFGRFTNEENAKALASRISFICDIASTRKVDIAIFGAFGCGVFEQDPNEVALNFKRYLDNRSYMQKVVFAVPAGRNKKNYLCFKETCKEIPDPLGSWDELATIRDN